MSLRVDVSLHTLHCITPTDPSGEDEPYLWVYYIRADGETIRQSTITATRLSSTVEVSSGPGRPGNLLVSSVTSGGNIRIPANVGAHMAQLRPIELRLTDGGTERRFFMPGVLFVVGVLIDEESVPRDAMEGAHEDVRKLLKQRLDDFFNAFDLQPLIAQAIAAGDIAPARQALLAQLTAFIGNRDGGLVKEAVDAAIQSAMISVMSSWNPIEHLTSALDPDEPVGTAIVMVQEDALIAANLTQDATQDVRQSRTGLGGAWYVLHGGAGGELTFTQADAVIRMQPPRLAQGDSGTHVFREGKLCIAAGSQVTWVRMDHTLTYDVAIEYPFASFEYRLDGQLVDGDAGVVQVSKVVSLPEFDPDTYKFMRWRQEQRNVRVSFARTPDPAAPQIERLTLTNAPADGSYWLDLRIDAVLNDGRRIFAGQHVIDFEGQTLQLPDDFVKAVEECLEPLTSNRFAKSVKVGPKELWGPFGRQQQYEQLTQAIDAVATIRGQDAAITEAVMNAVAAKLNMTR
jgi:hypothetical protein